MSKQLNASLKRVSVQKLALYHFQSCPFCAITREVIKGLEKGAMNKKALKIEQKDILKHAEFRKELIQGGGKPQVPCLKIEADNGTIHWLYESSDIIDFLHQHSKALLDDGRLALSA